MLLDKGIQKGFNFLTNVLVLLLFPFVMLKILLER
jgi:hypothetical protein